MAKNFPISLYYSTTAGAVPNVLDLDRGTPAFNIVDKKMFMRVTTTGNAGNAGSDTLFTFDLNPQALEALANVTINSAASKQVLQFNGSQWVNVTLTSADISDFQAKVKEIAASDTALVHTTGAETINGVKNFLAVPTINGVNAATVNDVDDKLQSGVTDQIGTTIQAHSDQLDKLAALTDAGLIYRKADGTIQGMAVEAADASVTVTKNENTKKITIALPAVGTAGTYFKVTTDAQGRVTAGENPTTLDGFGITDGVHKQGDTLTGLLKYNASVTEDQFDDNTLVPKYYADSVALGYATHTACDTGSNVNVEGTYKAGTSVPDSPGVGATFTLAANTGNTTAIEGVVLTVGMRVLLVGQTDAKQNGAYVVTNVPSGATGNVVMQRADDLDGEPHVTYNGASFLIANGTLKGTVWKLINKDEIAFGTDDIAFAQVFTPNAYSAGSGISIEANVVSVKEGNLVKVINGNLEVASGNDNAGKMLVAQGNGQPAQWKKIETDFQVIAPSGVKGDLMYHNGTEWVALNKGGANTILGVDGSGELTYLTKIEQGTF